MKRWDIFCKIVDNFGDIGFCWRLAKQLRREHGLQIWLWIDDLQAAKKIIPSLNIAENAQICDEIKIIKWHENANFSQAAEVVIEAFACELPATYLAAMAQKKSKWVNLEYLSAETWVQDFHGKPSPQNFINSNFSLTRYFYFPGFTEATGGLIRELEVTSGLISEVHTETLLPSDISFRSRAGEGAPQGERGAELVKQIEASSHSNLYPASGGEISDALKISLFCYSNAPIKDLFNALRHSIHAVCVVVPASNILQKIAEYFGKETVKIGDKLTQNNLTIEILPFLSQADYDQLLRNCDLNFVRGEDSWVRAIWAGKPFIWQPYFQDEGAHIKKLNAFLALFYADFNAKQVVCEAHFTWVSGQFTIETWHTYLENRSSINAFTRQQSAKLVQQTDLASKLVIFCNQI